MRPQKAEDVESSTAMYRREDEALERMVLRMNEAAWGISLGLVFGLGLFVATNVLVLRGGQDVGAHLRLLSAYLPGYRVTFLGSVIGFVYSFVIGYGVGRTIGTIYNRLARTWH